MSSVTTKHTRLDRIVELLLANPCGMTQADLARRLDVNRSTIGRNLADVNAPIYEERGRLFIDREGYQFDVRFSLHEALALHLAARLLAGSLDRANPHGASALRKLGRALAGLAPRVSEHMLHSADVMEPPLVRSDPSYLSVLETLTRAWAEGRKASIWYVSGARGASQCVFSPYYIEPKAVGRSTYVIGFRDPPGAVRTFKIERLERAELLDEAYTIPSGFDPQQVLADAWGIWFTDDPPVEVCLRFSPAAAQRVRETRWHPSEQTEEMEDGYLLWRAAIAEPKEMLPWIRGWGAEVEVLGPPNLRELVAGQAADAYQIYFGK